jgi:leucyl/phenylalanyl-tRNA--protein transferase
MHLPWLDDDTPFPDPESALTEQEGAPGLLAAGGDLSPARLLDAYKHGIFPWYAEPQPILWWSTDPRMVLRTDEFHVSHSLRKRLKVIERSIERGGPWRVCFDSAFAEVIARCAQPRADSAGTWITPAMIEAYTELHRLGFGHSAELWYEGKLVGGAYGICIGRVFFGESMFALLPDASKIALAYLVHFLRSEGVALIDCQQQTSHLATLGAKPVTRREFLAEVRKAVTQEPILTWRPYPLRDGFLV